MIEMNEKNLLIICITAIICIAVVCGTVLFLNNSDSSNEVINQSTNETNLTINDTNSTDTSTEQTKQTEKTTTKKTVKENKTESNVYGDTVHNGHKDYSHYKCGGHIIYDGDIGHCTKCGAIFDGDYVIGYGAEIYE